MAERPRLNQFPVHIQIPILWGDMDAFQHVNNTRFFRFMESARIKYTEELKLHEAVERTGVGPILAEANCKFIAPLAYPDTVTVGCRVKAVNGPSEIEQEYLVHSLEKDSAVAVGTARIAAYNYRQQQKDRFPEEVLRAIRELEGGEV